MHSVTDQTLGRPSYLLAMPLHAITEVYGEVGLRTRWSLELELLPTIEPTSARDMLSEALGWATVVHASQRRQREPYINHPLRVAIRIMHHYQVSDAEVLAAAVLHDTVEDQPWAMIGSPDRHGPPPREQAVAAVADRFGLRVADLVAAVTNPVIDPTRDRVTQYTEHLAEALTPQPWARIIKLSDFTDNGVGIIHSTGPRLRRSAVKYRAALPVMQRLLDLPDTPLPASVKQHIGGQLAVARSRFAAILSDPPPLHGREPPP